jgi:Uma2 family endonuclease
MFAPTKHRFTAAEYHRMAETGVLSPSARVELLDGEIIDMSPIGPFHGGIVARLTKLFNRAAEGQFHVSPQNPLRLDEHSEPEPDLVIAKARPDDYTNSHPGPEDVFLVIEVADSSLDLDRKEKLPAYGRAGVPEVWIVNLNDLHVEIYREPHFEGYAVKTVLNQGELVTPAAFPDITVNVSDLFRRQ